MQNDSTGGKAASTGNLNQPWKFWEIVDSEDIDALRMFCI